LVVPPGSTYMKWKTFLINLDHSHTRLNNSKAQLEKQGIAFERIPAVWGANLSDSFVAQVYSKQRTGSYYKTLNRGEIGCYLSHVQAWQRIVDLDLDFAVVLEDDFIMTGVEFTGVIAALTQIKKPWYYIKLGGYHKDRDLIKREKIGAFELVTFKKVPNRTCSQIVSKEGAKRLLKTCLPFSRPIDVDLRYWWEKDITVQALLPYSFMPDRAVESDILKFSKRKDAEKNLIQGVIDKYSYFFQYHHKGRQWVRAQNKENLALSAALNEHQTETH
jgi:glycosyl transferase, family 25